MESLNQTVSPLRQRMIEAMRTDKLMPRTQEACIRAVRKLAKFQGRFPDTATDEDLRRFQLHLIDQGTTPVTPNAIFCDLHFLFSGHAGAPRRHVIERCASTGISGLSITIRPPKRLCLGFLCPIKPSSLPPKTPAV